MQPKNLKRLLRALGRQGLDVTYSDRTYSVRLANSLDAPVAEVLLPEDFPVEAKALKQLANLASVRHPSGGCVCRACATPDFHPGDAGVAIGSVVETVGQVIPSAVGSDINCGMRLHVADLTIEEFLTKRDQFVERMKGDYFFGTRDVTMTAQAMRALFQYGVPGWLDAMLDRPTGSVVKSDLQQLTEESERIFLGGSMNGNWKLAPEELVSDVGLVRDGGLATIGGGNHFVEVQRVDKVENRTLAHAWGVREGQLAFMIHSGSRNVGKYIGGMWRDKAKAAWQKNLKYPDSQIFPLSTSSHPELVASYLQAEATAANYGFVNRLLLAELLRLRLREVYKDVEAPLVYDLPHNITLPQIEDVETSYTMSLQSKIQNRSTERSRSPKSKIDKWVTRKGACPAYAGQPVIIPGSMGDYSYLMVGRGNPAFCNSASHGAGRLRSRFDLNRRGASESEAELGLTGVDCITLREERRIEEAPAAYKPIQSVIDVQVAAGMVDVVARLSPVLTFKA
ncbi:RtcB protein [Nostoc linckia z18]|uniref:tRNA-splicing ligase RtcB n=2 Tax=Nostoc linckia TaxID=92942 RepID=A0A9Q5Z7Z4_NOSLI|nr:RtcB family protein [Nostoc linckia]PHK34696.1 RtcB protein [Nostoc linckia z15]PHK41567.1 RtcB protein [Nostoc linckia z16]PHJ58722.1 RtcB protein [Nostoc linckia z1]PHJ60186.1 RtcB protein [Nostoc linckia z2]PHJ64046.1 RtcB protein [Nostoc linckia z3]